VKQTSLILSLFVKPLADKLVRRHPHVFNNPQNKDFSIEEIKTTWEETKKNEGKKGNFHITEKDNLFPALHSASKIGAKTSKVNFDWTHYEQVIEKVEEELAELKEEIKNNNQEKIDEEMGDLLFSVAQLARHLKVEPEMSLHRANQKFITRFNTVEKLITEEGHKFTDLSHEQLEDYWIKSKNENK
jgi:MazG family protein